MMKKRRVLFFIIVMLLIVCLVWVLTAKIRRPAVSGKDSGEPAGIAYIDLSRGILLDRDTGEETEYAIEILARDDIGYPRIHQWIERYNGHGEVEGEAVYYLLYDQSGGFFDMYLFMPSAREILGDLRAKDITVSTTEPGLILTVDTKEVPSSNREGADLILHTYITSDRENSMGINAQLVVDGQTYKNARSTYVLLN